MAVPMDEAEALLAERIYGAILDNSRNSERGKQTQAFKMGVSDLGWCSERMRRMLDRQEPEDTDLLAAFIGTAIGERVEQSISAQFPDAVIQAEVSLTLEGDYGTYVLTGHPDVLLIEEGIVLDGKTDYGLADVERGGPSQQQQFQRHGYAKGAYDAGLFGDMPLSEIRVANCWVDRAAIDKRVHVQMEPYDPEIVARAAEWLDEVVYAYTHEEEARKEPPREMCAVTCGFFLECRAFDTDVEGKITDPEILSRIEMYVEGSGLEKEGRRLKDQAKRHLDGVSGMTGEFSIRWVHVNESMIRPGVRRAHDKLEIKKVT